MNSFISNFKAILIAIAIIAGIELSCWLYNGPMPFNNISFYQYAYLKVENTSNLALLNKLGVAIKLGSQFLQVGDSSGTHGVNPNVVEAELPNVTYTNASIAADYGYYGHYNIAKVLLARENHAKYLVMYVTPMAWPAYVHDEQRVLEKNVYSAFLSPWHYLTPPSLIYRDKVVNLVYYRTTQNSKYTASGLFATDGLLKTKGYVPRDKFSKKAQLLPQGACVFSEWFQPSKEGKKPIEFFYSGLEKMAKLARDKKIQLIVMFNPVTCEEKIEPGTLTIERELARFRQNYPEVIVPFPFITTWSPEHFMDSWHLYDSGATIQSKRVAGELKKILADSSYRGVTPTTVAEIDARLDFAKKHPSRPNTCYASNTQGLTSDGKFKNCVGLSFVPLEPRDFIMGSCHKRKSCPQGIQPDPNASNNESPAHLVKLKNKFQMSQAPVTIEQFDNFLRHYDGDNMNVRTANLKLDPDFVEANKGDSHRPVTMISWDDATAYVAWLNKVKPESDKGIYRLPTEAEWEFAARGGRQSTYWWGNDVKDSMANYSTAVNGKASHQPLPSGHYPANPYGLYDMNGNVWEWVQDCYRGWYSKKVADGRAFQLPKCKQRVLRGGSAEDKAAMARAATRFSLDSAARMKTSGFRVVREELG